MRTKGLTGILFICMAIALVVSSAEAQTRALTSRSPAGIQITNPARGESLVLGKSYPIRWKAAEGVGTLSIALFQNNKLVGFIAKGYPAGKGGYLWPAGRLVKGVPKAGGGYTIGVRSTDGKVSAYSPGPFSLTTASSAAATTQSGVVSGSNTTAHLPASASSESSTVSAPISTHTAPQGSIPQSGMTIQGAPAAKGTFVQRLVDLHFTNPEEGVIWEKGRTYTISWDKAGDIGSVKIRLNDLLNQSSLWVSQGQDHVISNTGTYRYTIPATLPDSAFALQIMIPDGSYTNKSGKFYISSTDTDLRVRAVNFGRTTTHAGLKKAPLSKHFYVVSELWLMNKGSHRLNTVPLTWKIVREPSGRVVAEGEKTFSNMTPGSWYKQNIRECYYSWGNLTGSDHKWGSLDQGETFVLILYADFDNSLGETELTRDDNTYRTEVVTHSTY